MPSLSQVCWMVEEGAELRCTMSCPPATQTLNTALYLHPVHLYYHQILVIVLDLSSALLRSKRSTLHCNRLYSSERDSLQIIKHSLCKVVPFPFLPGPSNLEAIWVPSSKKLLAATSSGNYTHCNAFLMFGWAISIWKPENCFETTSHWLSKVDAIDAIPNYNLKVSKSWSLSYYNLIYKLYYTGNSKPCQRTHIQDSHTRDTSVDIWSECFAGNIDEAAKIKTQGRKTGMWLSNVNFSWFSPGLLNISSDLKWDDTGAHMVGIIFPQQHKHKHRRSRTGKKYWNVNWELWHAPNYQIVKRDHGRGQTSFAHLTLIGVLHPHNRILLLSLSCSLENVSLVIWLCFKYSSGGKRVDYDDGYHRFNWLNMTGRGRECDWLLLNRFPGRPTDQREVCPAPHHAPYASYGQWPHMRCHTQGNLITRIRSPNSSTRVALIPHIFHFYMPTQFHIHQCIICNKNCRLMTKQCWSVLLSEDFLFDNIH